MMKPPGMTLTRMAAFSDQYTGGNPAGVVIVEQLPEAADMQRVAAEVGYSETVFAAPEGDGWRVRYFSPAAEVPFCGHATIALGAALALRDGDGSFSLQLNHANITVQGQRLEPQGGLLRACLRSPPTRSQAASETTVEQALQLFGLEPHELNAAIAPALIHAGGDHLLLALKERDRLARMKYDFEAGRALMQAQGWVTMALVYAETPQRFHVRNAFAYGGVYEDPATGAAAAALAGYLRDIAWPHAGHIDIVQGEDMGMRSLLEADIGSQAGEGIRVTGTVRLMQE